MALEVLLKVSYPAAGISSLQLRRLGGPMGAG
jgi:hypothetical protein